MSNQKSSFRRDEYLRHSLKNEFQKRFDKNPAFSLRSLANKVGIDQSLLSKLLQGKRKFSDEITDKVYDFLGVIPPKEDTIFYETSLKNYHFIEEDQFLIISSWWHFAILELAKTRDFKPTINYIAESLNTKESVVEVALERLKRNGYITYSSSSPSEHLKDFKLTKVSNTWVNLKRTSVARKNLQKQLHQKSLDALEDIPFDLREHSSLTVAVDPKWLPDIKEKITEFRRSLDKYIMAKGSSTEVYNLCVSFFPITNLNKNLKKINTNSKNNKNKRRT